MKGNKRRVLNLTEEERKELADSFLDVLSPIVSVPRRTLNMELAMDQILKEIINHLADEIKYLDELYSDWTTKILVGCTEEEVLLTRQQAIDLKALLERNMPNA